MSVFEQQHDASAANLKQNPADSPPGKPKRRWPLLLAALLVLLAVLVVLDEMAGEQAALALQPQAQPARAVVSYLEVAASSHAAQVNVLAEVKPRWQSTIKAFVRGEVRDIAATLREGNPVRKGQLLLSLQDSAYRAAVAEANNRLRRAEVEHLQAQRQAQQAQRNWQRAALGDAPDSPLTLHQPQLQAAHAELQAAQAALSDAKTQLAYTRVRAPYDGVIVSTSVNPGEAVEVGQPLVELLDSRRLDIPVLLDEQQWQLLAADWQERQAEVQNIRGDQHWPARMERQGGQVERDSRLRRLYLSVEQPGALSATAQPQVALLPGEFVRVQLPGRRFDTLLRVPQSAHTRDGFVWYLDRDDRLRRYRVQPLFADQEALYLPPPATDRDGKPHGAAQVWRIVLTPLASFVPGTQVTAEPGRVDAVADVGPAAGATR